MHAGYGRVVKRAVLLILVGSVVLNAALGVYALLAAEFGDIEGKILFTSLCVSGAGLIALVCAPALDRRRVWPLPQVGTAAGVSGFALLVAAIWLAGPEEALPGPLWKTAVTLIIAAGAAAYGSLLALARLAPRFRWVLVPAVGLSVLLAGLLVSLIWGQWEDEWFARTLGVIAVLLAAFTVLVPILHRASRGALVAAPSREKGPVRFCPSCGQPLRASLNEESLCPHCGVRFTVVFGFTPNPGLSPDATNSSRPRVGLEQLER
jgi:hypothetical protein